MDRHAKLVGDDTLRIERILPGPIERVWEYLTDSEKRGLWFASGEMETHKGGEMTLIFNNSQLSNPPDPVPAKYAEFADGSTSNAVVHTFEPPRLLVIHWEGGLVSFELEEVGQEVKLILTHKKLQAGKDYRVGTFAGWHTHLDILQDRLHQKEPKGFWRVHMALEAEYQKLLD